MNKTRPKIAQSSGTGEPGSCFLVAASAFGVHASRPATAPVRCVAARHATACILVPSDDVTAGAQSGSTIRVAQVSGAVVKGIRMRKPPRSCGNRLSLLRRNARGSKAGFFLTIVTCTIPPDSRKRRILRFLQLFF
ncbi:hypothetical protein [Bradyrhizobium uaiense]|uniref:Uncharacterized protein n=1 Tax=Bradyrhizobium uaiense TaxID=2594946 RepID=A0A6P1BG50_9BRAD|nr:hypothetical protein [Bradyrhizobium uaiense]NEU96472.1 hypothetical protein [Bradyrhizobium uaiense]